MAQPFIKGKVLDYGCGIGKLAEICDPDSYLGIDIDIKSLEIAREKYPSFRFEKKYLEEEQYDSIVLLALIEHIKDPNMFLKRIKFLLDPNGRVILTTPHPSVKRIYSLGSKVGLFSAPAHEEHELFLDYNCMKKIVYQARLKISVYKRFLLGANQLFVIKHQ